MKWDLEEFKEIKKDNEELIEMLETYRESELVAEVSKGFNDYEDRAKAYFSNDVYAPKAELFKINTGNKGEQEYYLLADEMNDDYIEETVFENYETAKSELDTLTEVGYSSIESEIDEFIKQMNCSLVEVKVKREHNNAGHFHSFNIYYDRNLFIDGIFNLNEDVVKEMNLAIKLLNGVHSALNGWCVSKIEKISGIPSWEKSYEITFSKNGYEIERTIELNAGATLKGFGQGQTKKLIELIQEFIDFDELDVELNEANKYD